MSMLTVIQGILLSTVFATSVAAAIDPGAAGMQPAALILLGAGVMAMGLVGLLHRKVVEVVERDGRY